MPRTILTSAIIASTLLVGCASKPAAQVSAGEMTSLRQAQSNLRPGTTRADTLDALDAGNKVKLGSAMINGASIEEWKVEAFHDQKNRKDLFVTFLYFLDEKLVDSSDTRIDFRTNAEIIDRWRSQ